tara:strand:- start:518 stop:1027 length:510 start_codon:yes stop_codon:yes gene_type:complete
MLENINTELNNFAKYVIKQARTNLTKGKKNSSKELYDSLKYEVNVSKNSFQLSFIMEEYGLFQDKGVSGVKKKYNTPYSYKDKMPSPSKLDKWIVRKGIALRDEKGKFISRKSLQFAIAKGIFNNGIKPSLFFTKPFRKAFENLDKEIIKAFELDVEDFVKNSTDKILK